MSALFLRLLVLLGFLLFDLIFVLFVSCCLCFMEPRDSLLCDTDKRKQRRKKDYCGVRVEEKTTYYVGQK